MLVSSASHDRIAKCKILGVQVPVQVQLVPVLDAIIKKMAFGFLLFVLFFEQNKKRKEKKRTAEQQHWS
jgi:uncharacterized membrane protein YozB (DUF420 family)